MMKHLSTLFLVMTLTAACAETQAPLPLEPESLEMAFSTLQGAIKGGYTDMDDNAVVGLVIQQGWSGGSCSGTLIAPNVVLTAQHCVAPISGNQQGVDCGSSEFDSPYGSGNLFVTTNTYMGWNSSDYHAVAEIYLPTGGYGSQWGNNKLVCGNDIALMILESPVPESEAVPMIPRVDVPMEGSEQYSAIGYGATGQNGGGSGTRRRRDNLYAECIGEFCPFYYSYSVKAAEWVGDAGVCQGDSGGPAVDTIDRVVGVASRGGNNCSSPVYGYGYEWADWLKEKTVFATQKYGVETPKWAMGWPTDPKFSFEVAGSCEVGTDCLSGICAEGVCSRLCSDLAPCPDGFACTGDPEICMPAPIGDVCEADGECVSGICYEGFCTRTCSNSLVGCPEGYTCDDGICKLLPVGYPCAESGDCFSGICGEDNYCTRHCSDEAPCPLAYYCAPGTDLCALMPVGHPCEVETDCWSGFCGDDGLCTRPCSEEVLCPSGYGCVEGFCSLYPVGHPCETVDDCFSGMCGDQGFCTRFCDESTPCPEDYLCTEDNLCGSPTVGEDYCDDSADCPTGWCLNNYCTVECDAEHPCPEGTECREDLGVCEAPPETLFELGDPEVLQSNSDLLEESGFDIFGDNSQGGSASVSSGDGCHHGTESRGMLFLLLMGVFGILGVSTRRMASVPRD